MRHFIPAIFALLVMAIIWFLDLPKFYGAHPWWSMKVVLIGAPIGVVVALGLAMTPLKPLLRMVGFAILTGIALYVAHAGKTQFAASYAEDALAGQMWYFGWIAGMAALAAMLTSLFQGIIAGIRA